MELFQGPNCPYLQFVLGPDPAQTNRLLLHLAEEGGSSLAQGWGYSTILNWRTKISFGLHVPERLWVAKVRPAGSQSLLHRACRAWVYQPDGLGRTRIQGDLHSQPFQLTPLPMAKFSSQVLCIAVCQAICTTTSEVVALSP